MRNPFKRDTPRALVDTDSFGWDGWPFDSYGSDLYTLFGQTLVGNEERVAPDYCGYVQQMLRTSPVIYACIANRVQMFSEARFQFQQLRDGRPGDLFGKPELGILEKPWTGGTTGDLLSIAEIHNSVAGNFFCALRGGEYLRVMRPDWTWLVLGSMDDPEVAPYDLDAEVIGYIYKPGGPHSNLEPIVLERTEVCHFMPMPDPEYPYRGMSWLTPVVQEVLADKTMTQHKRKFLHAGATPNLAINLDPAKLGIKNVEDFEKWVEKFQEKREGSRGNPYRTLFLAAGADPVPIGSNLQEVDFTNIQSSGEVRIAAAAGVHPAIVGFSEGLKGSALNSGNLNEAFRQFTNQTIRPLWRNFCGSMETLVPAPASSRLWYDDRDIPALQEDVVKKAQSGQYQAQSIRLLVDAGYEADSVVDAVVSGDLRRLVHSGLYPVQVQPATSSPDQNPADKGGNTNGAGQFDLANVTE